MDQRQSPLRDVKVVVRTGPRKLKIVLILLILASLVTLVSLGVVHHRIKSQTQAALDQAAELADKIENIGSSSVIEEIAREELGLVDPDTVIINPNSQ